MLWAIQIPTIFRFEGLSKKDRTFRPGATESEYKQGINGILNKYFFGGNKNICFLCWVLQYSTVQNLTHELSDRN